MYSQNEEEKVLLEYFGDREGVLLDLGAADGMTFSNTLKLMHRGWEGHFVEGSPYQFIKLRNLYEGNPQATLYNLVMGIHPALAPFYIGHEQVSSLNEGLMKDYGGVRETIQVMVTQLDDLPPKALDADFISIDLDGINVDFLKDNSMYLSDFEVVCIEHEGRQADIKSILNQHEVVYESPENLILVCEANRRKS